MIRGQAKLIERAATARRESKLVEFKSQLDTSSAEAWCELVKDIVAFANSGGGVIVFGVKSDGSKSSVDVAAIRQCDIADITNKILRYTNHQFADIEIVEVKRDAEECVAFLIGAADVPLVFTKPGTYSIGGNKQKTAFGHGTIYFRHGGKSEPGNRDDLESWREREIKRVRREWMSGIRKVVDAPEGHTVAVMPADRIDSIARGHALEARISADPNAPGFVPLNAGEIWPLRQRHLLREVNKRLAKSKRINGYDIQCVNQKFSVLTSRHDFAYKPYKETSPQYSPAYADWLVDQVTKNESFFKVAREEYRKLTTTRK